MRIAICDDNEEFLTSAVNIVHHWQLGRGLPQAADCFQDGDALIQAHTAAPYDIILLDVVMPLLNGIDAAREIRQIDKVVKIVFLTTSPDYAVESYTVKASNYLLKPLEPSRLFACLDELRKEIQADTRSIPVRSTGAVHRLQLNTIEYVEAQNKRVAFFLMDGRSVTSSEPLYSYENLLTLSDGFYKCSRSYIINIHLVDSYSAKEVKMRSGTRIPISRNLHKEFEEVYFSVLFGKDGEPV